MGKPRGTPDEWTLELGLLRAHWSDVQFHLLLERQHTEPAL